MTLTNTLKETPTKELLRALNSDKAYLFFDISVFNVGASIFIKCTDTYKEINSNTWNGYDFLIENDSTTKFYICETLKHFLKEDVLKFKTESQLKRAKKLILIHE
jgi:hypothetical protein